MLIIEFFQAQILNFVVFMALLGLVVGSFLNVVIYRLPKMLYQDWRKQCRDLLEIENESAPTEPHFNLIFPRSTCPACRHKISALENIPVLSYLLLRGRCKACGIKISLQYPVVETMSGLVSAYAAWHFGFSFHALLAALLAWALICLSVIDLRHTLLPDQITLPFLWLGLGCSLFGLYTDVYSSLIGAMSGYLVFWLVFMGFKSITGKEGMGYGDFKLLSLLGAWLGWQLLPLVILLSSLSASLVGLAMIWSKRQDKGTPFPFGPYLAVAGWVALLWGEQITSNYLQNFQ